MSDYAGMTTNERLYTAGLLDQYYDAFDRRDRQRMIELLRCTDIDQTMAEWIADTMVADPERYEWPR